MQAWRVIRIAVGGVLLLLLLGLIGDAAEGFTLTRTAPTPALWLGGLFLGGLASAAFSFLFDEPDSRPLGTDDLTDPLGRRILRSTLIGLAIGAVGILILLRFVRH